MSIATKRGDGYGTIDELIPQMGFARSICHDADIRGGVEKVQRELFQAGSALATPPESKKTLPENGPRWSRAW